MTLPGGEHLSGDKIEKTLADICLKVDCGLLDLVLLPWPSKAGDYDRKARTEQSRKMRSTWEMLIKLKQAGKCVKHIGVSNLEVWQLESLIHPSLPLQRPDVLPAAHWFTVSPWKSNSSLITWCHSRGIECLVRLIWDVNISNGGGKGAVDPTLSSIQSTVQRSVPQIVSLWGLQRGLVIFPDFPLVTNGIGAPKGADAYDSWRKDVSNALKDLTILLNPLFKKKPLWVDAFEINQHQMASINGLDIQYNEQYNDTTMVKAPKLPPPLTKKEKKEKEDLEKNEGGSDEDKELWEKEYADYYNKQRESDRKQEAEDRVSSGGGKGGTIVRNVQTSEPIKIKIDTQETQEAQEAFNPRIHQLEILPRKLETISVDGDEVDDEADDDESAITGASAATGDSDDDSYADSAIESVSVVSGNMISSFFPPEIQQM
jgi:hypothetical protein